MSEGRTNSVGDCCASICAVGPKWSERYRADVVADTKGWCALDPCQGKYSSSMVRLDERTLRLIEGTHTSQVPMASELRPRNMPTHPRAARVVLD